jgi:cation diffusion facilitator family transporter
LRNDHDSDAAREKGSAAFKSVLAALLLTGGKLVVGLATGSLGLLSEALHSGLDLVAAGATFLAVRLSDRPADSHHHYGHGKIENLAALFETVLLLVTCAWIVYEALQRIFYKTVEVEATVWAFVVVIVSIVIDVNRSRMLYRVARKHHSQALEADALHFSTDVWSSAVVLIGLVLVWLAGRLGPGWSWLARADAVAALGVAGIVVHVSLRLGKRAISVLLDGAPPDLAAKIGSEVASVPGVEMVGSVRIRRSGPASFADLTVSVDRSVSLEEAHAIATIVEERVARLLPNSDVVVHVDPVKQPGELLPTTVATIARRLGLRAHNVHTHEEGGRSLLDLHVEVPASLTLAEAHHEVDRLERAIREELPHVDEISAHIEPVSVPEAPAARPAGAVVERVQERVLALVEEVFGPDRCRRHEVRSGPQGLDVVLTCTAAPGLPVGEAHDLAEEVERRLRREIPDVEQVLIHVEPDPRP